MSADLLDMDYINSLPQPFIAVQFGDRWEFPVYDIDVQTGLVRLDVCGKLSIHTIGDFRAFRDLEGVTHPAEGFFSDATPEERAPIAAATGEQA